MRIRYQVGLEVLGLLLGVTFLRGLRLVLLSGRDRPICPKCGSTCMNPSHTPDFRDRIFLLFGCLPYRCGVCSDRFYRRRQAVEDQSPRRKAASV